MLKKFIFKDISSTIITINQDFIECKRYKRNLSNNNKKNHLYHIIKFAHLSNRDFLTNCNYINTNKTK